MTNALTEVRTRLAQLLKDADLHAFTTMPAKVVPPFAFVAPGDPYVSREGISFGGEIVRCNVGVISAAGVNDKTAEDLDDLLLLAVDAIDDSEDFTVVDVEQPGRITINGQAYPGVSIEVRTEIHRDREQP